MKMYVNNLYTHSITTMRFKDTFTCKQAKRVCYVIDYVIIDLYFKRSLADIKIGDLLILKKAFIKTISLNNRLL